LAPDPASRPAKLPRVVFLGDSLTAGLGVDAEQAFPALVGEALRREARPVDVVNAGVSGDTTAGGVRRLDWLLRQKPDVVVVGLGGNDGLRGLKLEASEQNLREIVRKSREAGASVLLLGMLIPPNYGPEYAAQFRDVYPRIAKETGVALVPFLLEGVGGDPKLNQPDGIHPTAEGHRIIAATVVTALRPLVPAAPVPPALPPSSP
jgi:acyl-CoA thioesterase-1